MDNPRTLLAVILSMAVIFVYYTWISPPLEPSPTFAQPDSETAVTMGESKNKEDKPGSVNQVSSDASQLFSFSPLEAAQTLSLEDSKSQLLFNKQRASMVSWKFNEFHEGIENKSKLLDLLGGEGDGFYLTLTSLEPANFVYQLTSAEKKFPVTFEARGDGLNIKKVFTKNGESMPYVVDISVEITNSGSKSREIDPRLWILRKQKKEEQENGIISFLKQQSADRFDVQYLLNGELVLGEPWNKMAVKKEMAGKINWTTLTDRYFLLGLVSRQESQQVSVEYGKQANDIIYTSLSYGSLVLKPGEAVTRKYTAYLGPKKRDELQKLGVQLEKSVDYGWFSFVAIPILWLLIFFEKIVQNWGLAIIVLTFFIKLLLHPINKKSMESMKAMQKLQPRLAEIREKYKNDRERLNVEMMQLFKTHKVNPMGGCLPLIIQMPVYIALYKVLWNAIEIYHKPFFWFYRDLAAPDPYLISPILLGIFFMLQQKFTPQSTAIDPAQQKMMMFMPLFFSVFMIFFPFGLVLYILVNTVMSVVQQYMMTKEITFLDLVKKLRKSPAGS